MEFERYHHYRTFNVYFNIGTKPNTVLFAVGFDFCIRMTIKEKEILEELDQAQTFIENCEKARDFGLGLDEATYEKYNYAISRQIELGKQLEALKNVGMGLYTSAQLRRKEPELRIDKCKIEAVIELDHEKFYTFKNNMLGDQDFILEHLDYMYQDRNGISHCLLVLGEKESDGILIESEGSFYARYSALLPNARDYIQKHIQIMTDELIKQGIDQSKNKPYRISFDEISIRFDTEITPQNFIGQMLISELETKEDVHDIIVTEDHIEIIYNIDFIPESESNNNAWDLSN